MSTRKAVNFIIGKRLIFYHNYLKALR